MTLTPQDFLTLERDSWIDRETAERFGLRRVDTFEGAALVGQDTREDCAGIVFPVYWPGDQNPRESYLRRDHPPIEKDKPKGKYLAPPGRGNMLLFGPGELVEALTDTTIPIVLVEGLKKLLAAHRLALYDAGTPRFLACAISGVWNWKGTIGKTTDATGARVDEKGVISDFDRIMWTRREVVIIFDSDCATNEKVNAARRGLMAELRRRGARVVAIDLPALDDRDKTGFDDLLALRGPEQALGLIQQAIVDQRAAPRASRLSDALVSYAGLLALKLPTRPRRVAWLPEGGIAMVHGPRGVGKTFLQLTLATSLAMGRDFLKWPVTAPVGVLYVDGEMQADELRDRTTALLEHPPVASLEFLTSQLVYQRCGQDLVLTSEAVRDEITAMLDARPDLRVLILDNISCLFSGINEDSKQDWEPINAWLIRLRHRGLATVLAHHSGKSGQQRGTSGREDALDTVIQLTNPAGTDAREGCHFELQFTKCRSVTGDDVAPLDVRLQTVEGRLQWQWQPVEESIQERAGRLFAEGVTKPTELAEELGIHKGYASRILKKLRPKVAV